MRQALLWCLKRLSLLLLSLISVIKLQELAMLSKDYVKMFKHSVKSTRPCKNFKLYRTLWGKCLGDENQTLELPKTTPKVLCKPHYGNSYLEMGV